MDQGGSGLPPAKESSPADEPTKDHKPPQDGETSPSFATTDQEAVARFQKYRDLDPFPSVPPTLLNSAEIADYVAATGMIYPFNYPKPAVAEVGG